MNIDTPAKKAVAVVASLVLIATAGWLIWRQNHVKPEEKMPQHVAMGHALGDEVIKALETRKKKRVLVIAAKTGDPAMNVQLESLLARLKQHPEIELKDGGPLFLEADEKHRLGPGHGMSAKRFKRIIEHNLKADAFVSLVGVPKPDEPELASLTTPVHRFIAETGDRDRVQPLIDKKLLSVAILPRFEFPAPVKEPKTEQEWFDKYYQIVRGPVITNDTKGAKAPKETPATNTPAAQ